MTTPDGPGLEAFADAQAQARFVENQDIARRLRAVTTELGEVTADRNRLGTENTALHRVMDAAVNLTPKPDWLRPRKGNRKGKRRVTLVADLSDLHAGEVVRPEEMGGFNAYNLRIADLRLRAFFANTIELSRDYFAGFEYDGIVLPLGGDLVSGSIHDELRETDELSVFDSTLWVAERLLAGLPSWVEAFGSVHVVSVPGNHGRDSKVPRYKGRSAHNADTHIARMLSMSWRGDGVTFDIPETLDASFGVYSTRFHSVHGDEYQKNNPGVAEIGSLGPVKRGTLRASRAAQAEGRPFDVNLVAHFHQLVYAPNQGFVMNGSVKGYDEYARGLSLKPEPPQQALWVVDPEYGCTLHAPIHLMDREAEGW
jgi:hypothetical protein